jgi:SAM-dependent methyltransferase
MGDFKSPSSRGSSPRLGGPALAMQERRGEASFSPDGGLLEGPMDGRHPRSRSGTRVIVPDGDPLILGEITRRLADYDAQKDEHERAIRMTLSLLDAAAINNLRYRLFAPHYDDHMAGHERAIAYLLRQFMDLEQAAFSGKGPLVHDSLLEMSCGTGTVIKRICEAVGPARAAHMSITANDISWDMKSLALEKLSSLAASVVFSSFDISRDELPRKSFGTIVLSQTLHLITDEEVVAQERLSNYMHLDSERHIEAKKLAVSNAWDSLTPGGTFIVIDEWPALLSDRGGPLGAGFAYLFNDGLREIDIQVFQDEIMSQQSGSKFLAQLKVPIDAKHHMHLLAYRKEERKPTSRIPLVPDFSGFRARASETVLSAFRAIDQTFIESLKPSDGSRPWVSMHPIPEDTKVVGPDEDIEPESQRHPSIVINQCMHDLDLIGRFDLINNAVRSLTVGGSLILIDEWNPPEGKKHSMRLATTAELMRKFKKNMVFAGSVRVPIHDLYESGMYGFQYRKVI